MADAARMIWRPQQPGGGQRPVLPIPGAAPVAGPTVSMQIDNDQIDPCNLVSITVIARDPRGLEWITWEGNDTNDRELDSEHRFDCNGEKTQASVIGAEFPADPTFVT